MKVHAFTDSLTARAVHAVAQADGSWREVELREGRFHLSDRSVRPGHPLPCIRPTALFCAGVNYADHAKEFGSVQQPHPTIFMKSPASVTGHESAVRLPRFLRSDKVDYEGELAVVIARDCRNIPPAEALDYVLGYCCANDVSARDWQKEWGGGQWSRGKSFDTFCPLGPCLVTADEIPDPQALRLRFRLNGVVKQDAHTSSMQFKVADLIAFLAGSSTLPAGAVILTGSPAGVGMAQVPPSWLRPGDLMEVEIEGIGTLRNRVEEESLA
jgi:2-keto-4-pentenoate hydratase/2-oxohepta-3-ene-1,7-dioic acid hydratase in catechol pathway